MNELVEVGIFDSKVLEYAVKLEFGNKGNDFLRLAYDTHQIQIGDYIADQYDRVFLKKATVKEVKSSIVEYVVQVVRNVILKKGLVNTGRMLNSVEGRYAEN